MERNFISAFNHVTNYVNIPPYLYRYENQTYIDEFFEKGDLYLSSFKQYKAYNDNELGDKSEGRTMNFGHSENDKTIGTMTTVGFNDYCFCTSTILDKGLAKRFKRDSAFRIKDPINFILEINRSLTRVREVLYGNCIYLTRKIIQKRIPEVELENLKDDQQPDKISFEKLMEVTAPIHGPEAYFIKKIDFQHQNEYRIIWKTDRPVDKGIIINCPEAAVYCEKVEVEETG